jgi:acetoin utilization deacetylase AcuC-like enzyme
MEYESPDGTKVDIRAPGSPWGFWGRGDTTDNIDEQYADNVKTEFYPRVVNFKPDLIFWYFGFDTHRGDYGSLGLSGRCYQEIARFMKNTAEQVSEGRLEVVLGGGSRTDIATNVIPPIIEILAE